MNSYRREYQMFNTNDERFPPGELREKLRKQLEYYFSRENLINDIYLQSQMDAENYVPISLIANFKLIKRLTQDLQLIIDVLKESSLVEVDIDEKKVRSSDSKTSHPTPKRCIIILRNVPFDARENEILELFINTSSPVSPIGCERVLESDHLDCWYVTFSNEDDAQKAFLYLTRENISIRGQKILARMKACLWQKASIPTQEPYMQPVLSNYPVDNLPRHYYHPDIPRLSFPTNLQQINMNFPQQTRFINRNHPVFPRHFWYIPSPITDSYSPMIVPLHSIIRTYNGTNKSKTRITTTKSRSSPKSIRDYGELSPDNTPHSSVLPNELADTSLPSIQPYSSE